MLQYASWDLAFHMIPMADIDVQFAKDQLLLFLREWYMHPNGQVTTGVFITFSVMKYNDIFMAVVMSCF
jgi:hypothetical protein